MKRMRSTLTWACLASVGAQEPTAPAHPQNSFEQRFEQWDDGGAVPSHNTAWIYKAILKEKP
jgi:hypothetical protein